MKRFSPPYKTLLQVKILEEKRARHILAKASFSVLALMEEKAENEKEIAFYRETLSRIERLFLEGLYVKDALLEEKISLIHKSMITSQKELKKATLSRKMIEKIQQKHYHRWKKRLNESRHTN